ncbi:hypothetical protein BX666DRAFT_1895853 [Dichotomocladium elegans]|nr:hypothetical protein BX666DRAFT_1895853 [Dichotomocladium elegans]
MVFLRVADNFGWDEGVPANDQRRFQNATSSVHHLLCWRLGDRINGFKNFRHGHLFNDDIRTSAQDIIRSSVYRSQ